MMRTCEVMSRREQTSHMQRRGVTYSISHPHVHLPTPQLDQASLVCMDAPQAWKRGRSGPRPDVHDTATSLRTIPHRAPHLPPPARSCKAPDALVRQEPHRSRRVARRIPGTTTAKPRWAVASATHLHAREPMVARWLGLVRHLGRFWRWSCRHIWRKLSRFSCDELQNDRKLPQIAGLLLQDAG
jgi:hypothetical protein